MARRTPSINRKGGKRIARRSIRDPDQPLAWPIHLEDEEQGTGNCARERYAIRNVHSTLRNPDRPDSDFTYKLWNAPWQNFCLGFAACFVLASLRLTPGGPEGWGLRVQLTLLYPK